MDKVILSCENLFGGVGNELLCIFAVFYTSCVAKLCVKCPERVTFWGNSDQLVTAVDYCNILATIDYIWLLSNLELFFLKIFQKIVLCTL